MAGLLSEDQDCPSKLTITAGEMKVLSDERADEQQWQNLSLQLTSGKRAVETSANEDVMLCRSPTDEIDTLLFGLEELLHKKRAEVLFEPSEPSFELSFIRTQRGGIKVEVWLDAGNGETGIYTWDACGIRFYTNDANIRSFIDELSEEFGI